MHARTHACTHTMLSPGVFLLDPPPVDLPCLEGAEERQIDHPRPLSRGGRATHLATGKREREREGEGRERGRDNKHNTTAVTDNSTPVTVHSSISYSRHASRRVVGTANYTSDTCQLPQQGETQPHRSTYTKLGEV